MDQTVLSFKNQQSGAQGLSVTSNNVILQDFAIEDAKGDAIKVKGVDGISFIRVRTEWTGGVSTDNGAYGLYPVESKNVLLILVLLLEHQTLVFMLVNHKIL